MTVTKSIRNTFSGMNQSNKIKSECFYNPQNIDKDIKFTIQSKKKTKRFHVLDSQPNWYVNKTRAKFDFQCRFCFLHCFIYFCILNNMLFGIVRCPVILLFYLLSSDVNIFVKIYHFFLLPFFRLLSLLPTFKRTVCPFSISNLIFLLRRVVFPVRRISIHFVELFWWKISIIINQVFCSRLSNFDNNEILCPSHHTAPFIL